MGVLILSIGRAVRAGGRPPRRRVVENLGIQWLLTRNEASKMDSKKALKITASSIAIIIALCGSLYALIVWEGSNAREDAPALEANAAQWLLHYTVPASFRATKNALDARSEEHTSELQSRRDLVCRLLLEKK